MSSFGPGSRRDHDTFCVNEEWTLVRDAKGKKVRHHRTYELPLNDGIILRTRISRPVDATDYGAEMWSRILRDQLCVSRDAFWLCVRDGTLPDRPGRTKVMEQTLESKSAGLVDKLIRLVGLSADEVAAMTKEEAAQRLDLYWIEQAEAQNQPR